MGCFRGVASDDPRLWGYEAVREMVAMVGG